MRAGEVIDFLGIFVLGSGLVLVNNRNMKNLGIGDMVGHMFTARFTLDETHACSIIAATDGLLAVFPFADSKQDVKKFPEAVFKLYQMASKHAMETFIYNLKGNEHNQSVRHLATGQTTKKLKDFYLKNSALRSFMNGVEKRDEKFIL